MSENKLDTVITADTETPNNRRKFLGSMGLMGAGAVLAACAPAVAQRPAKPNLDATIFNFALNLEYLEAAFYLAAVGRLGELDAPTAGGPGQSAKVDLTGSMLTMANAMNGTGMGLTGDLKDLAMEIADDELAHVKVIRSVLGGAAVAMPKIDLGKAFRDAGAAADARVMGFDPFNPAAGGLFFLHGAFIFEDVGVTAYKGAARLLVDDSPAGNLENAAGILAVEAYHAGEIRTLLYQRRADMVTSELSVAQVVAAISALRAKVGGGKDQGITAGGTATGKANIVPTDANGIAFSRTPREVLNIVYLGDAMKPGGFFPEGVKGDFTKLL